MTDFKKIWYAAFRANLLQKFVMVYRLKNVTTLPGEICKLYCSSLTCPCFQMVTLWMIKTFPGSGTCFFTKLVHKSTDSATIETNSCYYQPPEASLDEICIFEQDSVPGSSCTSNCGAASLPTCGHPNSPDLNPVDYRIWRLVQERVNKRHYRTLLRRLMSTWAEWTSSWML